MPICLREAQSIAKLGHWVYDVKSNVRKWSEEIFKILGVDSSLGELSLEKQKEIVHPEDWEAYSTTIKKAINEGISFKMEFRILRPDKSIRWINAIGNVKKDDSQKVICLFGTIQDVTEQKEIEEALLNERKRFLALIENAPFGLILIDNKGNFLYVNPKFKELFGYDLKDVPDGRSWFRHAFPDPELRKKAITAWIEDLKSIAPGQKRPRVFTVTTKDGKEKIVNFIPVQLESGEQIVSCDDITEQKILEKKLETMSLTDELTGLYNRRGFIMFAQQQIKIAERNKNSIIMFFIDLDHMKEINDVSGHRAGDMALIETANILKDAFRESDIIGRIGGDEFAVVAINAAEETIGILMERLKNKIDEFNKREDRTFTLSLSIGFSIFDPENPTGLDTLMSTADDMMYKEKKNKKNTN